MRVWSDTWRKYAINDVVGIAVVTSSRRVVVKPRPYICRVCAFFSPALRVVSRSRQRASGWTTNESPLTLGLKLTPEWLNVSLTTIQIIAPSIISLIFK